jgi:hypothetical protein
MSPSHVAVQLQVLFLRETLASHASAKYNHNQNQIHNCRNNIIICGDDVNDGNGDGDGNGGDGCDGGGDGGGGCGGDDNNCSSFFRAYIFLRG